MGKHNVPADDVTVISFCSIDIGIFLPPSNLPIDKGHTVVYDPPHGSVGQARYLCISASLLDGGFGTVQMNNLIPKYQEK